MSRTTPDSVALQFERTIPLMGDNCRTKASQRTTPPYLQLVIDEGKAQIISVNERDESTDLTDLLSLRDMSSFIAGMAFADLLRTTAPRGDLA